MREILFRGKTNDGKWAYGFLADEYHIIDDTNAFTYFGRGGMEGYAKFIIPETVGQFTGLTDKNGKKIFEGDIIRNIETERTEEIYFWSGAFGTAATSRNGEKYCYYLLDSEYCEDLRMFEVIGNIHDVTYDV